jgi:hypothetical protein
MERNKVHEYTNKIQELIVARCSCLTWCAFQRYAGRGFVRGWNVHSAISAASRSAWACPNEKVWQHCSAFECARAKVQSAFECAWAKVQSASERAWAKVQCAWMCVGKGAVRLNVRGQRCSVLMCLMSSTMAQWYEKHTVCSDCSHSSAVEWCSND